MIVYKYGAPDHSSAEELAKNMFTDEVIEAFHKACPCGYPDGAHTGEDPCRWFGKKKTHPPSVPTFKKK
jgi:hypothetical protein